MSPLLLTNARAITANAPASEPRAHQRGRLSNTPLKGGLTIGASRARAQPASWLPCRPFSGGRMLEVTLKRRSPTVRLSTGPGVVRNSQEGLEPNDSLRARIATPGRAALLACWVAFLSYASVSSSTEGAAADAETVKNLIEAPFSGAVNPLFEAQFFSLGVMPAVFAALLFPGAKDQKPVPALPFVASSFALGFFALAPYLIARELRTEPVKRSSLGFVTKNILEAKWNAISLLGFASYLGFEAVTNLTQENIQQYLQMWHSQALVNVSSVDLCILSLVVYNPMLEDMQRRGWGDRKGLAAAFCLFPVIGPAAYLLQRPSLED